MAEVADPVEWFAAWFACENVGFLNKGQCVSLVGGIGLDAHEVSNVSHVHVQGVLAIQHRSL
jgi:hypothetical protein